MTTNAQRITRSGALLAALLLMVGCSSGTAHVAASATGTTTVSTTATRTATTTVAAPAPTRTSSAAPTRSSSAVTSKPAPGPAACTNAQLAVSSAPASGGDSHGGIVVRFTDTGAACTLFGYPGAAVVDAAGHQIVQATRTPRGYLGGCGCTRPSTVRLGHGQAAAALIEGDNGGGDECLAGRALLVTPPNTTKATRIAFQAYSCHVQVHPVIAGVAGSTTGN